MSERPFMQLYVSDFLASTMALSAQEMGALSLLVIAAWSDGGALPDDDKWLRRVSRLTPKQWKECRKGLRGYFAIDHGRLRPLFLDRWARAERRTYGRVPIPQLLRQFIRERDGDTCRYCGGLEGPFHVDHIVPVALGGSDDPGNLAVACQACNLSKGSKRLEDWLA